MTPELSVYLDLMRLLAALVVFADHLNDAHAVAIWRLGSHGPEAVAVFFVLSGFVITHVSVTRERVLRTYAIARMARIYSVAIIAVAVTLLVDRAALTYGDLPEIYADPNSFNLSTGVMDVVRTLSFTNEIWNSHVVVGSNGPYWSIGFEVPYYAIFGVAIFVPPPWRAIAIAALLVFLGPKIALYLPLWLLGTACYRFVARAAGRAPFPAAAGVVLFLVSVPTYLLLHRYRPDRNMYDPLVVAPSVVYCWLYYYAVGILFAAQLIGFTAVAPWFTTAARRCGTAIRWTAGASFSLYLMHRPIVMCLIAVSPWPVRSIKGTALIVTASLAAILLLAELGERRKRQWQRLFGALLPGRTPPPAPRRRDSDIDLTGGRGRD